jgi:hypothetical protein
LLSTSSTTAAVPVPTGSTDKTASGSPLIVSAPSFFIFNFYRFGGSSVTSLFSKPLVSQILLDQLLVAVVVVEYLLFLPSLRQFDTDFSI